MHPADRHPRRPSTTTSTPEPHRYRTIWLSDIHLGSSGLPGAVSARFPALQRVEYLYLVGDIIDGWQLKEAWYWPQAHNDVVQKVLRKARKGTQVIYVPGNHDEAARQYLRPRRSATSTCAARRSTTTHRRQALWIVHGDLFDGVIQYAKWLAYLGDTLYTMILILNRWFNRIRARGSAFPTGRCRKPTSSTRSRTR